MNQDQNRRKIEKNAYFSRTAQNMRKWSGETLFFFRQQTENTHVEDERNENRSAYFSAGEKETFKVVLT